MINPSWLAICHHHGFKQAGTRLNASPKVGRAWLVFQQPHPKKNTRLWSPGFSEKRDRAFKIIKNSSWNEGYIQLHNVIEIDLKFHPQIDTKLTREKCMLISLNWSTLATKNNKVPTKFMLLVNHSHELYIKKTCYLHGIYHPIVMLVK